MTTPHASSCALHNAPACEPGPCDCGATDILERIDKLVKQIDDALGDRKFPGGARDLLAECAITIKALRTERDSRVSVNLLNALLKYGHHLNRCEGTLDGTGCTCGFDQVKGVSE